MTGTAPSRQETDSLARSALALVDRAKLDPYRGFAGMPYGGSECSISFYEVGETFVRIATLQDWDGDYPSPDLHVVVTDDINKEGEGPITEKETIYTFEGGVNRRHKYTSPSIDEVVATISNEGEQVERIHTAGRVALRALERVKMARQERKILKRVVDIEFDREHYQALLQLINSCGPENLIGFEDES